MIQWYVFTATSLGDCWVCLQKHDLEQEGQRNVDHWRIWSRKDREHKEGKKKIMDLVLVGRVCVCLWICLSRWSPTLPWQLPAQAGRRLRRKSPSRTRSWRPTQFSSLMATPRPQETTTRRGLESSSESTSQVIEMIMWIKLFKAMSFL